MNLILGVLFGFVAGVVVCYFVMRNPKNDQLKAKIDDVVDKAEKIVK